MEITNTEGDCSILIYVLTYIQSFWKIHDDINCFADLLYYDTNMQYYVGYTAVPKDASMDFGEVDRFVNSYIKDKQLLQ